MTIATLDFQTLANAGFPLVTLAPGEVVFAQGDKGDKIYVIRSGEVEIERDGKVVEKLTDGGIFGEMALIDGSPRAATARAKTTCEVAPITEKTFLFLVHETPFFAIADAHARRTVAAHEPPILRRSGPQPAHLQPYDLRLAIVTSDSHDRTRAQSMISM